MEQDTSWRGRVRLAARWGRRRPARGEHRHAGRMGWLADTAPGQAKGNGLNLSGGVWHEVTTSGTAAPSPSSGGSGSSGGGGYGY